MEPISFTQYQSRTQDFILPSVTNNLPYFALGLAGEVGEVLEPIKKSIRDNAIIDKGLISKELGDVLFYLTQVATCFDLSLANIAQSNINKLTDRQSRGVIGGSGDNR